MKKIVREKKCCLSSVPMDCVGEIIGFINSSKTFFSFQFSHMNVRSAVTKPVFNFPIYVKFVIKDLCRCPTYEILYVQKLGIDDDVKLLIENKTLRGFLKFFPRLRDIDVSTTRLFTNLVFKDFDLKKIRRINVTNAGGISYKTITQMTNLEELVSDEETIFGSSEVSIWKKSHPLPKTLKKLTTGMSVRLPKEAFKPLRLLEDLDYFNGRCFDEQVLKRLKRFVIWQETGFEQYWKYKSLDEYPFHHLSNLKELVLHTRTEFKNDESKCFSHLVNLEKLVLRHVVGFKGTGFQYLKKLKKLSIYGGFSDHPSSTIDAKNFSSLNNLREFKTDGFYTDYLTVDMLRQISSTCRVIRLCCKENLIDVIRGAGTGFDLSKRGMISVCAGEKCVKGHVRCKACIRCPCCSKNFKCRRVECNICQREVCNSCISTMCELCHKRFCRNCRVVKSAFGGWAMLGGADLEHLCTECLYGCLVECGFCGEEKCVEEISTCSKCERLFCWECSDCREDEKCCKNCCNGCEPEMY